MGLLWSTGFIASATQPIFSAVGMIVAIFGVGDLRMLEHLLEQINDLDCLLLIDTAAMAEKNGC